MRRIVLSLLLIAPISVMAMAQTDPLPAPERVLEPPQPVFGPTDAAEAETFFDGLIGAQLRHLDNVGATVSLVRGGEIIFAKGYGFADLANGTRVDPDETLFRIGSVTKLFVWTAVMQLVEEGKLDLDRSVADYLVDVDFHEAWQEPVTLAHLMTHSPGLEDRVLGLFSRTEESLAPLAEVLAAQTPAQVRSPGDQPSYSNHGTAVAAMIVEAVSGQSFRDYVQAHILDPLEMRNTSLDQPLPEGLAGKVSKGYRHAGDHFAEEEFELIPLYPAGTASASATDMAKLMIAYLQDGRYGEERILEEGTARRMRSPLLHVDPAVNTSPHGFLDMSSRGVRIIGHGGDTFWFHTLLAFFPDHDLGLFVSYNTDKGGGGRGVLLEAFLDRYFDPAERPAEAPDDFLDRADRYTGEFRGNRFAHTTVTKIGAAAEAFQVDVNEDGELLVFDGRYIETAPRVFTERNGESQLVFIEGDDGRMSHFYNAQFPIVTFERVPAIEARGIHLALLVSVCAMLLLTLIAWPAGWMIRRWFGLRDVSTRIPRSARLSLWAVAALLLSMIFGFVTVVSDVTDLAFGELGSLKRILVLPLIALIPLGFSLLAARKMWTTRAGTRSGRLLYTLTVVLSLLFYWQLFVWNLLGFQI